MTVERSWYLFSIFKTFLIMKLTPASQTKISLTRIHWGEEDDYEEGRGVIMHTMTIINNTMEILRITPQVDLSKVYKSLFNCYFILKLYIDYHVFRLMKPRLTWKLSSLLTNQTEAWSPTNPWFTLWGTLVSILRRW